MPETVEASLQLSEAALVGLGIPMGPVIASIHEKRDELRKQLADKLRYDRMSSGLQVFNNLNLGVQDGYVTLTGQVRDDSDRSSAE